jgi:hypothetical protein
MLGGMCATLWASLFLAVFASDAKSLKLDAGGDPPMRWLSKAASSPDLCAPCNAGSQCESGLCALDSNGIGFCTQVCDANTPCPDNFTCQDTNSASVCAPADATICPDPYLAPLNTFCRVPSSDNDPNLLIVRNCDVGLTCFVFPSGLGACVNACSALDANQACKFGQTCCFGTDPNGFCLASTATQSTGGCFLVQQIGDSCVQPDHSFCAQGSTCLYAQVASAAKCYSLCSPSVPCPAGGTCQTFQGSQVCCDSQSYNPNDTSTCAPFAQICKREVGVVCSSNADCRLGLCLKNNTQAACSTTCVTDADCPSASEDVNGDGVADGGSTCQNIGGEQRCWPTQGPAAQPSCATAKTAAGGPYKDGGCSCAQSQVWPLSGLMAAAVAVRRRARGVRRTS